jgi:septum formation protein
VIGRELVLASASPVRASLLENAGFRVVRAPAAIDEAEVKASFRREGGDACACAVALATAKAARISQRHRDAIVIGADQMLVCGEWWFDKPPDLDHARAQLIALRGRTHELVTAAVAFRDGEELWHHVARARLAMRNFSDAFLDDYLAASGDSVLQSVGAYQIERLGAHLFARVEGDWFTILGLPLLPLLDFLRAQP